jgi:hypothetical protein
MEPPPSLHRSDGCTIEHAAGVLRVRVGPGLAQEVQECYRSFVHECLQRHCRRALIEGSAAWDAFNHLALRDALRAMAQAGLPEGFRLALVALTPDLIAVYDAVLVEAGRCGIEARRFRAAADALGWLAS